MVTAVTSQRIAARSAGPHHHDVAVGAVAEERPPSARAVEGRPSARPRRRARASARAGWSGRARRACPSSRIVEVEDREARPLPARRVAAVAGEHQPSGRRPRPAWCPRWRVRSVAAPSRRRSSRDGPPASAGWKSKNRRALTKPTSHSSSRRTRCGSQTAIESSPSVGQRQLAGCRGRGVPCSRSAVGLGERDPQPRRRTTSGARRRVSKSPHVLVATSHPPPSRTRWVAWSPKTPGRSGRRKKRSARCAQVEASPGRARHTAGVGGVEEARSGAGGGQQRPGRRPRRYGVPSASVTNRTSRSPSWPKPPARSRSTGPRRPSPASQASSRVSTRPRRSTRARAIQARRLAGEARSRGCRSGSAPSSVDRTCRGGRAVARCGGRAAPGRDLEAGPGRRRTTRSAGRRRTPARAHRPRPRGGRSADRGVRRRVRREAQVVGVDDRSSARPGRPGGVRPSPR